MSLIELSEGQACSVILRTSLTHTVRGHDVFKIRGERLEKCRWNDRRVRPTMRPEEDDLGTETLIAKALSEARCRLPRFSRRQNPRRGEADLWQ